MPRIFLNDCEIVFAVVLPVVLLPARPTAWPLAAGAPALGLIGLVRGDTFPWGPMMAASLLGALPPTLVYVVSQRWVVSGLAAGSVKG